MEDKQIQYIFNNIVKQLSHSTYIFTFNRILNKYSIPQ